jgi:hypothetical protein
MAKFNRRRALFGGLGVAAAAFLPKLSKGEERSLEAVPANKDAFILPDSSEIEVYETPSIAQSATVDPQCLPPVAASGCLPTPEMNDILRQCASPSVVDSSGALNELTNAINFFFEHGLHDKLADIEWVSVPVGALWMPDEKCERMDLGTSVDVKMEHVKDARWDVVGRAIQLMQEDIIRKVNDKKCEGAAAEFCGVWPDFTVTKQRRIGWYTWVELYLPRS